MSRRFGRNQKRRLREELELARSAQAQAAAAAKKRTEALFKVQDLYRKLEQEMIDWASRIRNLMGEGSAFAREFDRMQIEEGLYEAMRRGQPLSAFVQERSGVMPTSIDEAINADVALETIKLFILDADVIDDHARMRRVFQIQDKSGRMALALDERTLYEMRRYNEPLLRRHLEDRLINGYMRDPR